VEISQKPNKYAGKRDWNKLLKKMSASTQRKYKQHYKDFIGSFDFDYKSGEDLEAYSQNQLDAYASNFYGKIESRSAQKQRVAALRLFLK
jgi:hypothetical protein